MNNCFTNTFTNITTKETSMPIKCTDENTFLDDLFSDKLTDVGYIQFIPKQNRICITATISKEEHQTYQILKPRLEFLKFMFKNSNEKVKKGVRHYFTNSDDIIEQRNSK